MKVMTAFIAAAARHLLGEPPAKPVASLPKANPCQPLLRLFNAPQASATMTVKPLFVCSALPSAPTQQTATLIRSFYTDANVQRQAGRCRLKLVRLIEEAAFRSEVARAIEEAVAADEDLDIANVTSPMVAEMLRRRALELDDALDSVKDDHRQHDAAARQVIDFHRPLRDAASARFSALSQEASHIAMAIDAIKRSATMEQTTGTLRYHSLVAAGLNRSQIAALGVDAQDPDARIAAHRARFVEIEAELPALKTFLDDPLLDSTPLAGLGFDELIAQRTQCDASEVTL